MILAERQSLIVTTNLPFENWTEVRNSERRSGAMLDRLVHRVHIIEANGSSYLFISEALMRVIIACRMWTGSVAHLAITRFNAGKE